MSLVEIRTAAYLAQRIEIVGTVRGNGLADICCERSICSACASRGCLGGSRIVQLLLEMDNRVKKEK